MKYILLNVATVDSRSDRRLPRCANAGDESG